LLLNKLNKLFVNQLMSIKSSSVINPFPTPNLRPYQWDDRLTDPVFDAAKHLEHWDLSNIRSHKCPGTIDKFGFTEPFKVLSDEGYKIARGILDLENEQGYVQPDRRIQLCLRGVTYRSPFLRDFSECSELSTLASELSGEPLIIHPIISNHSHVNWGLPTEQTGVVKNIDQWHQDSVSHVLIILMSDMSESVGGELELILKPTDEAFKLLAETNNNIPDDLLVKIRFPGPGYGVFVTGSELVHHVTPLIKSSSPRITLIQSFASADPWVDVDRTKWDYYSKAVSADWAGYEWMHYQSWKLGSQLLSLPQRVAWTPNNTIIANELRKIADALNVAANQIELKTEEQKVYYEENNKE
jgi:hypothetical protein